AASNHTVRHKIYGTSATVSLELACLWTGTSLGRPGLEGFAQTVRVDSQTEAGPVRHQDTAINDRRVEARGLDAHHSAAIEDAPPLALRHGGAELGDRGAGDG